MIMSLFLNELNQDNLLGIENSKYSKNIMRHSHKRTMNYLKKFLLINEMKELLQKLKDKRKKNKKMNLINKLMSF